VSHDASPISNTVIATTKMPAAIAWALFSIRHPF
jgi:hypothetical protein